MLQVDAIAALCPGDLLQTCIAANNRWELLNQDGLVVGRLASRFEPPANTRRRSAKVLAGRGMEPRGIQAGVPQQLQMRCLGSDRPGTKPLSRTVGRLRKPSRCLGAGERIWVSYEPRGRTPSLPRACDATLFAGDPLVQVAGTRG